MAIVDQFTLIFIFMVIVVVVAIPIALKITNFILEKAVTIGFLVCLNIVVTVWVMSYCAGREDGCIIDVRENMEWAVKNIPLLCYAYIDIMRTLLNTITGPAFTEYVNRVYQTK